MRKKVILPALLQPCFFRSFERVELVRLRPTLPGLHVGDHCVRAGPTKSTSFPRAIRKGIGGEQEERGVVGRKRRVAMKEDCGNKISVQEKVWREARRGEWEGRKSRGGV